MEKFKSRREDIRQVATTYLKGLAMGAADSVPGVSGGTIAVIVGIYERLIEALTSFRLPGIDELKIHRSEGRRSMWNYLVEQESIFLFALVSGILTSVVLLSRVMHYSLENFRASTFAFFSGLILASVVVLYSEVRFDRPMDYVSAITGFVLAFMLSGASATGLFPSTPLFLFLTGLVAISAMILPGISGSFILLILGQYEYLTGVLNRFIDGIISLLTGEGGSIMDVLPDLVAFGTGAITGVFSIAYLVRWMLKNYREYTFLFLVSLMAGSLRLPVIEIAKNIKVGPLHLSLVFMAFVSGSVTVILLDRFTDDLDY